MASILEPHVLGRRFVVILRWLLVPLFSLYLTVAIFRYPLLAQLHIPYLVFLPIIIISLGIWLNWVLVGVGICTDPLTEGYNTWLITSLIVGIFLFFTSGNEEEYDT